MLLVTISAGEISPPVLDVEMVRPMVWVPFGRVTGVIVDCREVPPEERESAGA